ncbi:MAG: LacI family DNA-binding transcriptional regulator [Micrococcaceae bacterium]
MMEPKLDDVARLANLSKTTVSRVLNNRGYLSQKTIDKVYEAMAQLNYQPNAIARQLSKKKTMIIGLIFPTVANPFFGELIDALERRLYQQGFKVLIGNSMNDPKKETSYLNQLLSKQVDGLIVGTHNQGIKEYEYKNLPIVSIDRNMNEDIPIVESDNYAGGAKATKLLLEKGAKNIIHINGPTDLETPAKRRKAAYEDVMRDSGIKPITITVDFNIPFEQKKEIFYKLFAEYPEVDGIFAANDVDAAMVMQIAQELGRKIPDELKVIGYDGTEMMRNILPNLTTIIQPIDKIADIAIEVLNLRIKGEKTESEYIIPIEIWSGNTC